MFGKIIGCRKKLYYIITYKTYNKNNFLWKLYLWVSDEKCSENAWFYKTTIITVQKQHHKIALINELMATDR